MKICNNEQTQVNFSGKYIRWLEKIGNLILIYIYILWNAMQSSIGIVICNAEVFNTRLSVFVHNCIDNLAALSHIYAVLRVESGER